MLMSMYMYSFYIRCGYVSVCVQCMDLCGCGSVCVCVLGVCFIKAFALLIIRSLGVCGCVYLCVHMPVCLCVCVCVSDWAYVIYLLDLFIHILHKMHENIFLVWLGPGCSPNR